VIFECEAAIGINAVGVSAYKVPELDSNPKKTVHIHKCSNHSGVDTVAGYKGITLKNNEWCVKNPKQAIPRIWIDITIGKI
jgi:hypothetical protein